VLHARGNYRLVFTAVRIRARGEHAQRGISDTTVLPIKGNGGRSARVIDGESRFDWPCAWPRRDDHADRTLSGPAESKKLAVIEKPPAWVCSKGFFTTLQCGSVTSINTSVSPILLLFSSSSVMSRCCEPEGGFIGCGGVAFGAQSDLGGHKAEADNEPAVRFGLLRGYRYRRERDSQEARFHYTQTMCEKSHTLKVMPLQRVAP